MGTPNQLSGVVVMRHVTETEAQQCPSAGPQHPGHLANDGRVLVPGNVGDRVVGDDRGEASVSKGQRREITPHPGRPEVSPTGQGALTA